MSGNQRVTAFTSSNTLSECLRGSEKKREKYLEWGLYILPGVGNSNRN